MIEDFIEKNDKNKIKKILQDISFLTVDKQTTKKFLGNFHVMMERPRYENFIFKKSIKPKIVSPYYDYFLGLVNKFCKKHGLKYKKVIRASLNKTYHIPDYIHGDPHIDFFVDHIVFLLYLSNSDVSSTLVFDKVQKFDGEKNWYESPKTFPIIKEVFPSFGKIFAFNGRYYHTNIHPAVGEDRIVCVFNLLIDKPWYRYLGYC